MIMFMPMGSGGGDPKSVVAALIALFILCLPGAIYGGIQVYNGIDLMLFNSFIRDMWLMFSMAGAVLIAFIGIISVLTFLILELLDL